MLIFLWKFVITALFSCFISKMAPFNDAIGQLSVQTNLNCFSLVKAYKGQGVSVFRTVAQEVLK